MSVYQRQMQDKVPQVSPRTEEILCIRTKHYAPDATPFLLSDVEYDDIIAGRDTIDLIYALHQKRTIIQRRAALRKETPQPRFWCKAKMSL